MDWKFFIQILVTLVVAMFGAWIGHRFSSLRDVENERRKLRIQYLLDAYRRLESASNRPGIDDQQAFESAVADVQLLGSPAQVGLARALALAMAENGSGHMKPLIEDLRSSLRSELRLKPAADDVVYLRLGPKD